MRDRLRRAHGDVVAGPEDQEARAFESVAGDFDFAVDEIDRALFVIGVERQRWRPPASITSA